MTRTPKQVAELPRPSRWKKKSPRPLIDSIHVGVELRRELEYVARAYQVSLSEVVRTFVMAHAGGDLDVEFERHRKMMEARCPS